MLGMDQEESKTEVMLSAYGVPESCWPCRQLDP
jgi:hypothetical protein